MAYAAARCASLGCPNFGSKERNGLCSQCARLVANKCSRPSCANAAEPGYANMCVGCFVDANSGGPGSSFSGGAGTRSGGAPVTTSESVTDEVKRKRGRIAELERQRDALVSAVYKAFDYEIQVSNCISEISRLEAEIDAALRGPMTPLAGSADDAMAMALKLSQQEATGPKRTRTIGDASESSYARNIAALLSSLRRVTPSGICYLADWPEALFAWPAFDSARVDTVLRELLLDAHTGAWATRSGIVNFRRLASADAPATGCSELVVVRTPGDGGCLTHAAALALWSLTDAQASVEYDALLLRSLVRETMCAADAPAVAALRERFAAQVARTNARLGLTASGADLAAQTEAEYAEAIAQILSEHSAGSRQGYLGELHVFVLANVLRRPIVVYGDDDAIAANVAGVFLPLLWDAAEPGGSRAPLLLLFGGPPLGGFGVSAHFSALAPVAAASGGAAATAYLARRGGPLPVQFLLPHEADSAAALVAAHMRVQRTADGGAIVALADESGAPEAAELRTGVALMREAFFAQALEEQDAIDAAATPTGGAGAPAFGSRGMPYIA